MSTSVTFDGTEIVNSTYLTQFSKHESAADRSLLTVPLARVDGEVFIGERYGTKIIRVQGTIIGTSQTDVETKIDAFKELFSRPQKNLDISWVSGTRRYVATCTKHDFDRDHYHISGVPWTAEFTVVSGVGSDTATTTAINAASLTTAQTGGNGDYIYSSSFTISGSKAAAPTITMVMGTCNANMLGIEFINTDTNERIIVTATGTWTGATLIIDCANKRVLHNIASGGTPIEASFYGIFPTFKIGTNNFTIRSGGIISQTSSDTSVPFNGVPSSFFSFVSTNNLYAIGFTVPYTDPTYGGAILGVSHTGSTPSGHIFVEISPDASGVPSGSPLTSGIILNTLVPAYTTYAYLATYLSALSLTADTRYWLIMGAQTGTSSDHYLLNISAGISYPRGSPFFSTNSGSTWTANSPNDPAFRILFGGQSNATPITLTIAYTQTFL